MGVKLLAIETSGDVGSVALLVGDALVERTIASPREQTESVLPHVHALLSQASLDIGDLDGVSFGRGPGSFTGLRVAASVAHGFNLAAGLPLFPVSSLAAIAQGVWRSDGVERCLVCLDARMGEVFWATFEIRDGLAASVSPERLSGPTSIAVDEQAGPWTAVGSGFAVYSAELAAVTATAETVVPDASAAARDLMPLALHDLDQDRVCSIDDALPVYLRPESAWKR